MSPPNGHANRSGISQLDTKQSVVPAALLGTSTSSKFTAEQIKHFVDLLEVPFNASVIEWRVTSTGKGNGRLRGPVIPYTDQRAYTDRLNALFTPAGWTRKYTVHTSANFERSKDQKTAAKVFVTCDLTIFGLGSHAATGEEWTDDENAGTSAEAQAFKRACACFGLGRYLYYFRGTWVDLDERKQPRLLPTLPEWATPYGWSRGLRPFAEGVSDSRSVKEARNRERQTSGSSGSPEITSILRNIEAMQERLGTCVYRGMLKNLARVWNPREIQDPAAQQKVLRHMQAAERGFERVKDLVAKLGREPLIDILSSLSVASLERVADLNTLKSIVLALEAKTKSATNTPTATYKG